MCPHTQPLVSCCSCHIHKPHHKNVLCCFVVASLLGNTLIHTRTLIITVCLGTHRKTDLYYFYTLTSQLILTGRTIIIIVEEMFTEFSVYHDLKLCPGDCFCNCSVLSLSFKFSSSFTSTTSLRRDPSANWVQSWRDKIHHYKKGE